jgi:hypothetical protein
MVDGVSYWRGWRCGARRSTGVWAAYGWEDDEPAAVAEDAILARLLSLNARRASIRF